jgi:hypothetical protein
MLLLYRIVHIGCRRPKHLVSGLSTQFLERLEIPKQAAQVLLDILLSLLMSPYIHYASFSQSLVYHVDGLIEHDGDIQ